MITLLIETSTERSILSLFRGTVLLFHAALPFGYNGSTHLMPTIEQALAESKISVSQIQLIAACSGPGSYTGMRVGAVVGKTLSYTLKIPLVGFCSLEGFIPAISGPFAALIDEKIGCVYLMKGNM